MLSSFACEFVRMVRRLMVLAFVVLLAGRAARSMNVTSSEIISSTKLTAPQDNEKEIESTDEAVRNVLIDISNGIFRPDDAKLISLIKKGIVEAAKSDSETIAASIEAGAKQAQRFVTETTAAYTAAIFRADTAQDAQEILIRFQDTVQQIVDYAKTVQFTS